MDRRITEFATYRVESVFFDEYNVKVTINDGTEPITLNVNTDLETTNPEFDKQIIGVIGDYVNLAFVRYEDEEPA